MQENEMQENEMDSARSGRAGKRNRRRPLQTFSCLSLTSSYQSSVILRELQAPLRRASSSGQDIFPSGAAGIHSSLSSFQSLVGLFFVLFFRNALFLMIVIVVAILGNLVIIVVGVPASIARPPHQYGLNLLLPCPRSAPLITSSFS